MNHDIVDLLQKGLSNEGMAGVMEAELSNHSTITLDMKEGIPALHIQTIDDEVWVWCELGEISLNAVSWSAATLLPIMLDHNEDMYSLGQPSLYHINEILELRAQIKEKHLDTPEGFLIFLDDFLGRAQQYQSILA